MPDIGARIELPHFPVSARDGPLRADPEPPGRFTLFAAPLPGTASHTQDGQDLAKQLSNPIANLTSVDIQFNYDSHIGPSRAGDGLRINIQPMIPFKLDSDWTLISRTIVPVIYQNDVAPNSGTQFGLATLCRASSFRPLRCRSAAARASFGAWVPRFCCRRGQRLLKAREFGAGPTVVALVQQGSWTVGVLSNHIWSIGNHGVPTSLACDNYACSF